MLEGLRDQARHPRQYFGLPRRAKRGRPITREWIDPWTLLLPGQHRWAQVGATDEPREFRLAGSRQAKRLERAIPLTTHLWYNVTTSIPLHFSNVITYIRLWIMSPRQCLLISYNKIDAAMSYFSQSGSLTHILTGPNIMKMSSALVGPNISPYHISITFAPLHFKWQILKQFDNLNY